MHRSARAAAGTFLVAFVLATLPATIAWAQEREDSPRPTLAMDAMVGQVNGEAIYANEVIAPIREQLASLSQRLPQSQFLGRARQLVAGRVQQIVTDALVLGEARRSLTEGQRRQLRVILQRERERILREYGRGALAVAERNLQRETGAGVEEFLRRREEEIIVQQFQRTRLMPRINVSRKDIARYYRENESTYNPPPVRDLQVLISDSREAALELRREIASNPAALDAWLADSERGVQEIDMGKTAGNEVFGDERVNRAMLDLKAGELSVPIAVGDKFWILRIRDTEQKRAQPLREVQIEISNLLAREQFQRQIQRYREELFETGSYDPLDEMSLAVMRIVVSRYAPTALPGISEADLDVQREADPSRAGESP
jgi:hypothetical protein